MCAGCRSQEQESSMGHEGIAIAESRRFEGVGAESMKFEGMPAQSASDAKQTENSGFGS